ncbi:metal-transporting ATPase PfeT [soil metagenome]
MPAPAPSAKPPPSAAAAPAPQDWVQRLSEFLAREASVEAILVDPAHHTVSLATLGEVDTLQLQQKLQSVLRTLDEAHVSGGSPGPVAHRPSPGGITVRLLPNETLFEKPSCPTAPLFWKWREFAWPEPEELEQASDDEWKALAFQASICGLALAAGFATSHLASAPPWLAIAFYLVSLVAGAWDAAIDAFAKIRKGQLDIHFLMLAVAIGAVAIGAWTEGALLLFLFSASGAMEHYALHRTHREINALTRHAPKFAHLLLPDGETEDRPVDSLRPGDLLLVRPDEAFPVDGELLEGETAADESTLTGEASPVPKSVGDTVFSGTLNLWGAIRLRTTKLAAESSLQKIIRLIQRAQHLRAPSQRFTDRFGTRYTYAILGAVTAMFFVWWLGFGHAPFATSEEAPSAFYRAMTLLVVASPCALVLSIPSAILAAIAWGAKNGILFRGGAAIEKLAEIDTIALDKTGTLTTGELTIDGIESFPPGRERDVADFAFTLERNSNHPIARAITAYGKRQNLQARPLTDFRSLTGKGLRGQIEAKVTYLGRRELLAGGELAAFIGHIPEPPVSLTEVWVVHEDLIGRILLKDEIRRESKATLDALARGGIHTIMLTGDRREAAEQVASELGIQEIRAGLHPEDKVAAIKALTDARHRVAMVGDGVNDAPCLAAADVSIALGGRGSDAALEQSDVVLMRDRIEKLLTARRLSLAAKSIIRQNLAISLGTILIMVTITVLGHPHLTLGVIAHEGSTVLVCLNSLRLLFLKPG